MVQSEKQDYYEWSRMRGWLQGVAYIVVGAAGDASVELLALQRGLGGCCCKSAVPATGKDRGLWSWGKQGKLELTQKKLEPASINGDPCLSFTTCNVCDVHDLLEKLVIFTVEVHTHLRQHFQKPKESWQNLSSCPTPARWEQMKSHLCQLPQCLGRVKPGMGGAASLPFSGVSREGSSEGILQGRWVRSRKPPNPSPLVPD